MCDKVLLASITIWRSLTITHQQLYDAIQQQTPAADATTMLPSTAISCEHKHTTSTRVPHQQDSVFITDLC
jgi:hypothetical protein